MSSEDETAPVVMRGDTHVEFASTTVPAMSRAKLSLPVTRDMPRASLFASVDPREQDRLVVVEEVACGGVPVLAAPATVESLRFGRDLGVSLASGTAVTVDVHNTSDVDVRVGASVVSNELVNTEKT